LWATAQVSFSLLLWQVMCRCLQVISAGSAGDEISESLEYREIKFELHLHLSKESQEVYQLFLEEGRISKWLFARKTGKSRYFANPQYEKFVEELALLTQ
jgi:hypothetical protein